MKITFLISIIFCAKVTAEFAEPEFLEGYNKFTTSVYKALIENKSGNVVVSPLSVETVLALTQIGAVGITGEEIRAALHLPDDQKAVADTFQGLLSNLKTENHYRFKPANKIYIKNGFPVKKDFRKIATEKFYAGVQNVDFSNPKKVARTINNWVQEQTNNKIQKLVNPSLFSNHSRAVLVNALYFKGWWAHYFKFSFKGKFHKKGGDADVEFLRMTGVFNYFECEQCDAKILELPLRDDASFTIILPNDNNGLSKVEKQEEYKLSKRNFTQEFVNVTLPAFKIEQKIDFKEILTKLGVVTAFDEDKADFSELADTGDDRLVIEKIYQKAFIEVSQSGVEAAAATLELIAVPTSIEFFKDKPKIFNADHPFFFYVKVKGVVVFIGRFTSPKPTS